jgi:hypothetical protein
MAELFEEQFGAGQGVILGVQALWSGAAASFLRIADITLNQTNISPKRTGVIDLRINNDFDSRKFLLYFDLTDESYDQRTLQGYAKKRNPDAVTN